MQVEAAFGTSEGVKLCAYLSQGAANCKRSAVLMVRRFFGSGLKLFLVVV